MSWEDTVREQIDRYKYFAGHYPDSRYNHLFYPKEGVRYFWCTGWLGGAWEYGDNTIMDSKNGKTNVIFACDHDEDAEKLCEYLNRFAADEVWA